jgi:hypothetical protein
MAAINIKDGLGVDIVSANPHVNSGFGKYLKGKGAALLAGTDAVSQLRSPLHLANPGEGGLKLSWKEAVPLGANDASLNVEVGARATLGVYNRKGMELVGGTFLGPPVKVPAGIPFISFTLHPTLALGLKQKAGALTFGFSAGSEMELQCCRPCVPLEGEDFPTVREAAKELFENFVIPNTTDDLREMRDLPEGTLACASGMGRLQVAAAVDVAAAFNPLASVSTLPKLGALQVQPTVTASVGVSASVSGGYQIRVQKLEGALVRLSVHTSAGRGLEVSLAATAGAGVSLGERDLLGMLFKGPGGLPGAAKEDLVKGGITTAQLDRVTSAMKGALSRKLELAIAAQFSSLRQDDAAFVYEVDLDGIDAAAAAALDRALGGDLAGLNELEPEMPAHGLRLLRSGMKTLRERKVQWRINLVGIVNILSMRDLVRTGTVTHDEESGEVLITDKITSDHVGAIVQPKQIRKLLYESTMITLTYKAAGLDVNRDLAAAQSFYFFDKDANRQRMSDFLDAVTALGLTPAGSAGALLAANDEFGKASLLLETSYEQAAAERAFGVPGPPPDQDDYEAIGRSALLALVTPTDPDAYRRIPLERPTLWKDMKDAGQPSFRFILPPPITGGGDAREAIRVGVVTADYSLIVWWASAMALAAKRLAEMRKFLGSRKATDLETDKEFRKRRTELEEAMVKAVRKNTSSFDDPWGLIALFLASQATAEAAATIVSPKLTLFLPE